MDKAETEALEQHQENQSAAATKSVGTAPQSLLSINGASGVYFARWLRPLDNSLSEDLVDEKGLLSLAGNKVILGEPGMGKSELMRELGRQLDAEPVSAVRFIKTKKPAALVSLGKPLLIDGLDEAMSRREGDAIDAILAQLEEVDSPPFILSCRSREWQARGASNLKQLYGAEPHVVTLEPLSRPEAQAYLHAYYSGVDVDHVLEHLSRHSLEELYRNPLTLGLMGRVAKSDTQLPETRAALFERVCALIWPEHDPDRQEEGLAQLTEDQALDAAGAIAAGLLFAGAEAASAAGAAQVQQGDLRLAELENLPAAAAARSIFSSKLFSSVGPLRAKLLHRVIAEFLGARWLARQAKSPRTQRRVLAQLHGSGGVPASLRGLHAWLAYHSPEMAEQVIAKDPFGVLRHSGAPALNVHLADRLFEALHLLADEDPYFRAADLDSKPAAGLMIKSLQSKIDAVISSANSNEHFRSLLIEGLQGTSLSVDLADTLEAVLLSPKRFFRERDAAADALLPHRDRTWWQFAISELTSQQGDDAPRLARQLIEHFDADVTDDVLVATIFAEMELTSCPLPQPRQPRIHTLRLYDRLIKVIPPERRAGILDLIVDYAELLCDGSWREKGDINEIVAQILICMIEEQGIDVTSAPFVWRWLGVMDQTHFNLRDSNKRLAERLAQAHSLRHAIQSHVLAHERRNDSVWMTSFDLERRLVSLNTHPSDLVCAFSRLNGDASNLGYREDWKDLVRIAWRSDGMDPEVRVAAEPFRNSNKNLADFFRKMSNPKRPAWKIKQDREAVKRARKRKVDYAIARREFTRVIEDLRSGELAVIVPPAKAYFDLFHNLPQNAQPAERLAEWLGPALRDVALAGFEAVLHRPDLPTAVEIAHGFAQRKVFNYSYAIMAGLHERMRIGKGVADLPEQLKLAALLLSYEDPSWSPKEEKEALRAALEAELFATLEAREAFARLWIEPMLHAGREQIHGLYSLAHDPDWQATGARLASQWLIDFPSLPPSIEANLVDCLTFNGSLDALHRVAEERANAVCQNFQHMLSWLAIDVLVRFDDIRSHLTGIGTNHPEFIWNLRDRLQFERRGRVLPLTVAQAEWVIAEFRGIWSYATLLGSSSGTRNDYDATDFLRALISRLADDIGPDATAALQRLIAGPNDSYTKLIRHMAAEQRQKRAEEEFLPVNIGDLTALLGDGAPGNIGDLKALVLEEMEVARRKLIGDDLDTVFDFWTDAEIPRNENRCRDRLAAMIDPELARYGIQRITEADMPQTKRADLAFARGAMQLPVEVKGQWHPNVWDAATSQLDVQYLADWRSEQRGIYCVLWFGDVPSASGRRLRVHPDGLPAPATAEEMCSMLTARIPEPRRAHIDVIVLDLSAGHPDRRI